MRPAPTWLAFLAQVALFVTVTSSVQAQTPTALPPLSGDTQSEAVWINDLGEVVGNSIASDGFTKTAVLWDNNGTPTPLLSLDGETGGSSVGISILELGFTSIGNAINNKGEIAGTSAGTNGPRAVVWNRNGTILRALQPVDLVGSDINTRAAAINAHGWVAGVSSTDLIPQPVVWDQRGNPTVLSHSAGSCSVPGGAFLFPTSINPRGQVASACNGLVGVAVVWDRRGGGEGLPPLSGLNGSNGHSINARGHVAGESYPFEIEGVTTATVWDHKRSPRALPPLDDSPSMVTRAFGINDQGEVVGTNGNTAVVWDRDGNPTALPPIAGDTYSIATGINRRSVVVGVSVRGSAGNFNRTAVIWR